MNIDAVPGRASASTAQRGHLGAWVANEIAHWIAESRLAADDPLPSEAELAERYGVSVRVVRDALRILSSQGVIATSQGRRAAVANRPSAAIHGYFQFATASDSTAVAELFEVRIALETRAAALATQDATDENISDIEVALAHMRASASEIEAYAEADLAWHAAVVSASHNRFLIGIHTALAEILRSERIGGVSMRLRAGNPASRTIDEHAEVTSAIAARDAAAAERAMRSHLERPQGLYVAYRASARDGDPPVRSGRSRG